LENFLINFLTISGNFKHFSIFLKKKSDPRGPGGSSKFVFHFLQVFSIEDSKNIEVHLSLYKFDFSLLKVTLVNLSLSKFNQCLTLLS
jgi:hypothetical protein